MKKMIFAVALIATLVLAAGCSDKKETLHIYSIIHEEETKALTDWARIYGINRYTLYDRIEKRGWSVEKALETPAGARKDGDGNG